MRLKAHEVQMLTEMREHYESRVGQAQRALQRDNANPLFEVQAKRDQARADLLYKIIDQTIVE
jgi:hypothetical protein